MGKAKKEGPKVTGRTKPKGVPASKHAYPTGAAKHLTKKQKKKAATAAAWALLGEAERDDAKRGKSKHQFNY